MPGQVRIPVIDLSPEAVAGFGTALMSSDVAPTSGGPWWSCWEGLCGLSDGRQWVGFVRARAESPEISEMEREPGTEIIIPVDRPIIQVVAPGAGQDGERPDASRACALLIRPGTALLMNAGVWHAAAFGQDAVASYFYIAERRRADESEGRGGWVALTGGKTILCRPAAAAPIPRKEPFDD